MTPENAHKTIHAALAKALAPRKSLAVSEWADSHRILSKKGSAEPGPWRTSRNPPLREPMDCLSARSPVRDVVLMFPIQAGKTECAVNILGYSMEHNPGPIMVCLPGEVSMNKWVQQKLNPMIEECPVVQETLTTLASRDASNTRTFKDFAGGQLYLEHAGSPSRLKSTSVRTLIVDELDEFSVNLTGGDDPLDMLIGRTSAFPATYKRLYISTPGIQGISRTEELWEKSDQRRYYVNCPHCNHEQHMEWSGLKWNRDASHAWYVCQDCGVLIEEHLKTEMIATGKWVPAHPERKIRGYNLNCLYYQLGLGPRWAELARMWLDCQNDPARLKTFINDRLAQPWEDRSLRAARFNVLADRAEPYRLRHAPADVIAITVGVDTQDNRLAVQMVGWGRGFTAWVLDYVELPGDPAEPDVWVTLTELLNTPVPRDDGAYLSVQATAIDTGGHRSESVKHYCRERRIRRPMAITGAVAANAPVLSRPKLLDVSYRGRTDKKGVTAYQVGTVAVKHALFSLMSVDAEKDAPCRRLHFSNELELDYFTGLVSETFDPRQNRFVKKRGARNEPLDTLVYAYAAAYHAELRYHTLSAAKWELLDQALSPTRANPQSPAPTASTAPVIQPPPARRPPVKPPANNGFAREDWQF
jgi:phage terminase large subunit GpA-like protein